MTDLEIVRACAVAMGMRILKEQSYGLMCHNPGSARFYYDPLHDDAQAMALVKKLKLDVVWSWAGKVSVMSPPPDEKQTLHNCTHEDLNRAICECVAKMGKP